MSIAHELLGPDFKIIDSDTHFTEPADLWTKRAPAKYKDRVPLVRPNADGLNKWYVDGLELMNAGAGSIIDKDGVKTKFWNIDMMNHITVDEAHAGSWDVSARLEVMDEQGVWAHIVYPNVAGFGAGRLLRLEDRDLAYAIVQIYNDAVAEWQAESNDRLLPQMLVPFWDMDHTLAEIQRCHDMGLRGMAMSGEPFNGGLPDLGNRHWDPMYELCSELDFPINIHIGSGDSGGSDQFRSMYGARTWASQDAHRAYVLMCVQLELTNSNFLSNLVTSDILVRYPKLKFVSVESGIGWIPYVLERTDYQLQEALPDDPALQRPSAQELFRQSVYATFWFEDSAPRHSIADVGFDNVMFETDFPHPTCLYPNPVDYALERLKEHDVEDIKKVMGGNAAKLYKVAV
ncbi:amidohydrolase family protein [Desertimonas flava]|uniref:amidohydrolase family protein n=1 Tax=Desertimonas flava TaxID=2064846 RepID=UPI000E348686|nr:amidohydrolase family protein [Desertimonas flava]